jgi:indole-3-glycerol phosphate synthase
MTKDFLSAIIARKRQTIAELYANCEVTALRTEALKCREDAAPHRVRDALQTASPSIKIIAEFKRISPSRGLIRAGLSPAEAARSYERGGACAISVLTDEEYFGGSIDDLIVVRANTGLPILRKDFIIDPIQIYQAAIAGADAILLIAAVLNDPLLQKMRAMAEDELGLDALIEAHTADEMQRASAAGAKLIGINNRDLHTFEVSLQTSERLIAQTPPGALTISESGLQTPQQLHRLRALGFCGFLIGESLMRTPDPAAVLRDLLENANQPQIVIS